AQALQTGRCITGSELMKWTSRRLPPRILDPVLILLEIYFHWFQTHNVFLSWNQRCCNFILYPLFSCLPVRRHTHRHLAKKPRSLMRAGASPFSAPALELPESGRHTVDVSLSSQKTLSSLPRLARASFTRGHTSSRDVP